MDSIQSNVPKLVWTFYFRLATQPGDNTINNSADSRYQGRVTCHLLDTNNDSPLPRARDAALVAAMRGMWRRYAASV